jgi:hypothetical protein
MVIGLSLITALLGLSFTTHRAAIVQQDLAADRRAADGALEAAVEQVRNSPDDPCQAVEDMVVDPAEPQAGTVAMTSSSGVDTVWVRCFDEELDPTPLARGDLRVLGSESYGGAHPWDGGDPSDPDLFHQGRQPASFVGGVAVAGQGAFDSNDSGTNGGRVSGSYAQGGGGCDVLSPADGPDPERTLLDADTDDAGEPVCDSDAVVNSLSGLKPADVAVPPPTSSTVPASCAAGSVTEFAPGLYSVAKTAQLASLLSADCNATYWFRPGTYWFDAPTGAPLTLADVGSSFVFGGSAAPTGSPPRCSEATTADTTVVLGPSTRLEHTGGHLSICGGTANPNPALLRSLSRSYDEPTFDSVSSPLGDFRFNLNSNPTHPTNLEFLSGTRSATARTCTFLACNGGTSVLRFGISSPAAGPLDGLEFRWNSFESPIAFPVDARRVRARLALAGNPVPICDFSVERGRTNDVGSRLDLQPCLDAPNGPDDMSDLDGASLFINFPTQFAASPVGPYCLPECPYRITVSQPSLAVNSSEFVGDSASSSDNVAETDWSEVGGVIEPGEPAASTEPCTYLYEWRLGGVPQDPVEVPDFCDRTGDTPTERNIKVSGFDSLDVDQLTSLVVAVDNGPGMNDVVANPSFNPLGALELGATRVDVNGQLCSRSQSGEGEPYPGYPRSSTTWFIDILPCLSAAGVTYLSDAEVSLGFLPEKNVYLPSDPLALGSDVVLVEGPGLEIPQIDFIRLLATTRAEGGITSVTLTSGEALPDGTGSEGTGTSARVYGDADLHLADLDVRWLGKASEESLFNGTLTVNTLSSWQDLSRPDSEVGTVCCGPNYPNVKLVAYVDDPDVSPPSPEPPIRGLSRVRLETRIDEVDPSAVYTDAVIADWQLCHLDGCPL